jgi:hypothetical protein
MKQNNLEKHSCPSLLRLDSRRWVRRWGQECVEVEEWALWKKNDVQDQEVPAAEQDESEEDKHKLNKANQRAQSSARWA